MAKKARPLDALPAMQRRSKIRDRFGDKWGAYVDIVEDYRRRRNEGTEPKVADVIQYIDSQLGVKVGECAFRRHATEGLPEVSDG